MSYLIIYVIFIILLYVDINISQSENGDFLVPFCHGKILIAIVAKTRAFYDLEIDGETEITVACGATAAMISALLATVDPGDAKTVSG
jgi:hypothetical protein